MPMAAARRSKFASLTDASSFTISSRYHALRSASATSPKPAASSAARVWAASRISNFRCIESSQACAAAVRLSGGPHSQSLPTNTPPGFSTRQASA